MLLLIAQIAIFLGFATVSLLSEIALISALYGFCAGIWFSLALNSFFQIFYRLNDRPANHLPKI